MHVRIRRALATSAVGVLLAAGTTTAAYADDISNTIDAFVDATAEQMALTAGGANGSTTLVVTPANADGKAGCNLTGQTTATFAVGTSNAAAATVSPSSVTFSSCGDAKTLTVTPHATGSASVSLTQTANNTGGTFNLAPATFTVNVAAPAPSNTAPQVVVDGVIAGASYDKDNVPVATCRVTDPEDGNSSFPATLSSDALDDDRLGSQTARCSYTDDGGLTVAVVHDLHHPRRQRSDGPVHTGSHRSRWRQRLVHRPRHVDVARVRAPVAELPDLHRLRRSDHQHRPARHDLLLLGDELWWFEQPARRRDQAGRQRPRRRLHQRVRRPR